MWGALLGDWSHVRGENETVKQSNMMENIRERHTEEFSVGSCSAISD